MAFVPRISLLVPRWIRLVVARGRTVDEVVDGKVHGEGHERHREAERHEEQPYLLQHHEAPQLPERPRHRHAAARATLAPRCHRCALGICQRVCTCVRAAVAIVVAVGGRAAVVEAGPRERRPLLLRLLVGRRAAVVELIVELERVGRFVRVRDGAVDVGAVKVEAVLGGDRDARRVGLAHLAHDVAHGGARVLHAAPRPPNQSLTATTTTTEVRPSTAWMGRRACVERQCGSRASERERERGSCDEGATTKKQKQQQQRRSMVDGRCLLAASCVCVCRCLSLCLALS